jgi:hypothetical protein
MRLMADWTDIDDSNDGNDHHAGMEQESDRYMSLNIGQTLQSGQKSVAASPALANP